MYLLDLDVSSAFNTITLAFERLLKSPLASAHVIYSAQKHQRIFF